MSTRADRICAAARPPIPGEQAPGGMEIAPVVLSSTAFVALDNKKVGLALTTIDSHLDAAFKALVTAAPELGAFFSKATRDEFDADRIAELMNVYGRFRTAAESLSLGDLVESHGQWSVVVDAEQRQITRSVGVQSDAAGEWSYRVYEVRGGATMDAARRAWQPLPQKVLLPSAQIGQFWGPNLSTYRGLLYEAPGAVALEVMLDDLLWRTRYDSSSMAAFLADVEQQLYVIEEGMPLWPGSILFTERDDEIAIMLADATTVFGVSRHNANLNAAAYIDFARFGARYIWYPHL